MKKLMAFLLCLLLLPVGGLACPETENETFLTYTDPTVWAQTEEFLEVAGMLRPDELVQILPVQNPKGCVMRGFLPNGIIRVPARLRVILAGETILGLRVFGNTAVQIGTAYAPIVEEIVKRELGEEAELSAAAISACILYWLPDGSVTERVFPSYVDHFIVGQVLFNLGVAEGDLAVIAIGDWNGDGLLDLGLTAGNAPEPQKPEPEPEPEKTPEPEPEKTSEKTSTCDNAGSAEKSCENGKSTKTCLTIKFDFSWLLKLCVGK